VDKLQGESEGLIMGVRVRQKTKGKGNPWWVFISHNGKRTSRKVGDKKAADAVASTIRAKLQLGEFGFEDPKPVPTFKEYADSWIKTTVPATCKESTVHDYKDTLRIHVLPTFGDLRVTDINRGKVKDFLLDKINSDYAKSTVGHMKNVLSGVFTKALDDEIIQANPTLQLGKNFLRSKDINGNINVLTSKELKFFLDTVKKRLAEHYALILLLARTGMRIGEALALKWGDLDFNGRFIEVKRSVVRDKITTPKSGKTRRVDMSLQLLETLKAHELVSKKKGLALGLGDLPEYVFTNRVGRLIDKNSWRRRIFYKAVKKAGLRQIRIHDLRHTYATLRISKGDNVADVSNQLGHHSVKLTMDVYCQWFPGKKKDEVDGLDDPDFLHPSAPYTHPALSERKKRPRYEP
jgi:integrase